MIYSVDVRITAPVRHTELEDRVARAITALFPDADVERRGDALVATVHDLEHLSERLEAQRILDTARGTFLSSRHGDRFEFSLKKQAALQGVVNFAVGEPAELGEIDVSVTVEDPDVESYVEYVAPHTDADGRPVDRPE